MSFLSKALSALDPTSLITGIGGGVISGMFSRSSAKSQNKATREAAQNQFQWAMQDAAKAGLNPMLVVSQGGANVGNMAQAATPDFSATYGKSSAAKLANSQAKLQESLMETELTKQASNLATAKQAEESSKLLSMQAITEAERAELTKAQTSDTLARVLGTMTKSERDAAILRIMKENPVLLNSAAGREAFGDSVVGTARNTAWGLLGSIFGLGAEKRSKRVKPPKKPVGSQVRPSTPEEAQKRRDAKSRSKRISELNHF